MNGTPLERTRAKTTKIFFISELSNNYFVVNIKQRYVTPLSDRVIRSIAIDPDLNDF